MQYSLNCAEGCGDVNISNVISGKIWNYNISRHGKEPLINIDICAGGEQVVTMAWRSVMCREHNCLPMSSDDSSVNAVIASGTRTLSVDRMLDTKSNCVQQ